MGSFLAQDQPCSGGPGAHIDRVGGLGDPRTVTDAAAGIDRRVPRMILGYLDGTQDSYVGIRIR
jgi:hypothetical protein